MHEKNLKFNLKEMIDLLAEDELDSQERNGLFDRLDQDTGGWKACAMTLLETRALQHSFNQLRREGYSKIGAAKSAPTNIRKSRLFLLPSKVAGWMSVAVLLFGAGLILGHLTTKPANESRVSLMQSIATGQLTTHEESALKSSPNLEQSVKFPEHLVDSSQLSTDPELLRQLKIDMDSMAGSDLRLIGFLGTRNDNRRKVYPIVESEKLAKQLAALSDPRLPKSVTEKLKRIGWLVETQKQLVSIPLANGRRQTLPVGTLNYRYVGKKTY